MQESFALEAFFVLWLVGMAARYFQGRATNLELTKTWMEDNIDLLTEAFAEVGSDDSHMDDDDGQQEAQEGGDKKKGPRLIRDNSSNYTLYCTGRSNCRSCIISLEVCRPLCTLQSTTAALLPRSGRPKTHCFHHLPRGHHDPSPLSLAAAILSRTAAVTARLADERDQRLHQGQG